MNRLLQRLHYFDFSIQLKLCENKDREWKKVRELNTMPTSRERQQAIYYQLVESTAASIAEANELAKHLGIETRLFSLHLYKEQLDQIEEIQTYFRKVGMPIEQSTEDEVLIMALKHFQQFIDHLQSER